MRNPEQTGARGPCGRDNTAETREDDDGDREEGPEIKGGTGKPSVSPFRRDMGCCSGKVDFVGLHPVS